MGFGSLINQGHKNINGIIVVFDADESIYILRMDKIKNLSFIDLFYVLIFGERFIKSDLRIPMTLIRCITDGHDISVKSSGRKQYGKLSSCEEVVIKALLNGYTPNDMAIILNRSVKTISSHKNNALRKLGFKTIWKLHKVLMLWNRSMAVI